MDFMPWDELDFGTERKSKCGICGTTKVISYWYKGEMQGDIICSRCDNVWVYDEDRDGYTTRRTVPFAVDAENGMFICPCGKEAEEHLVKICLVKISVRMTKRIKCYVCGTCSNQK